MWKPTRPALTFVSVLASVWLSASLRATPPPPPSLSVLRPGAFLDIAHTIDVNIVFVGYDQGTGRRDIDRPTFLADLPSIYRPIHRFPDFYGMRQHIGLTYAYRYNPVFTDGAFEDEFFSYLSSISDLGPRTLHQNLYNTQSGRSLSIDSNYEIDAQAVETWLADHPPAGVDPTRYTIFFVNWYGRSDFRFHVYVKQDEPDPDTHFNHGVVRPSRRLIAWGGTSADDPESGSGRLHRVWFYDLSAGPEAWTVNWNLNTADLDANGVTDYRMPPSWDTAILRPHSIDRSTISRATSRKSRATSPSICCLRARPSTNRRSHRPPCPRKFSST